jgi:hypothetical protein
MQPCELEDFQEFVDLDSTEKGYCRFTGELKLWIKLV